jgi:cell pole-organizing protein PopZ
MIPEQKAGISPVEANRNPDSEQGRDAMQQPGEPSVEEILDSIKKVIARDNRDGMIAERRRKAAPAPEPVEPADEGEAEEVLELDADFAVEADEPTSEEAGEPVDALLRDETREAMRQNFAALAMLSQPSKPPQIVRSGETSLEGLVRDLLRPMLAKWLDENLPGMVEDMVKAEIARIAGKKA